jgi:hypothetical protein
LSSGSPVASVASTRVSDPRGWIATQIRSSIGVLLAARLERQVDLYGRRKFLWTLMRHFLALTLLPGRMPEASITAGLVSPTCLP